MTEPREDIDRFIQEVRARLNCHLLMALLVKGLCGGGGVLTAIALVCCLAGRRVALFWYPLVAILALGLTLAVWVRTRRSLDDAAIHLDAYFGLKDGVRSYRGFSQAGQHGDLYDLQADQTRLAVAGTTGDGVKAGWPVRSLLAFVVLMIASLWLTSRAGPPPAAAQTQDLVVDVGPEAEQLNTEIREALEQIQEQVKADQIDQKIAPEELQKMAHELKAPADLKEALRQYSRLESQLNRMLPRLEQRKDEQVYKKMGEALQRSDATKGLGRDLAQRKYKEAGQELARLKIDQGAPPERKAGQLDKIRDLAQRMAHEARQQNVSSKAADLAQRLDQAAREMAKAQANSGNRPGAQGPRSSGQGGQGSGSGSTGSEGSGSEGAEAGVNDALEEMADHLSDLDSECKAKSAIQDLCKSLSDGQSKMCNGSGDCKGDGKGKGKGECKGEGQGEGQGNGSCDCAGNGSGDGGLKPGTGSSSNVNTTKDKPLTSGQQSQLKGIKGQGPSIRTTEAATDGSGSSLGSMDVKAKAYEHQFEDFVRREDVSETVKAGVKAYFEDIHKTAEGR
ncbi:MAG: cell envelope integrity protein TolA [Phycisphaerae bacterium]|nr:cell envelope integrity protein TolA [Phycisphaerae bacterium]